jgi:hypothetical protein
MRSMRITEALVAEHTIFLSVFDQIERVLPSLVTPAEVRTMASIVEGLLEGHAKTETNLAYLALDHVLEHNGELKRMYQDHHEIDERLRKVHTANTVAEARRLLKMAIGASRERVPSAGEVARGGNAHRAGEDLDAATGGAGELRVNCWQGVARAYHFSKWT